MSGPEDEFVHRRPGLAPYANGSRRDTSDDEQRKDHSPVLRIVQEQPGLNIQEIATRMGVSRGTVRYYLRRLLAARRVAVRRQGNHRLHFATDLPERQRTALALLRVPTVRTLVDAVMEDPVVRVSRLADQAGFSRRAVRRAVRCLTDADLADDAPVESDRGARRVALAPEVRIAWVTWCKDAQRPEAIEPLAKAPGFLFALHAAIANLVASLFA